MIASSGAQACTAACDATRVYVHAAVERMEVEARRALSRIAEGDGLRTQLALLRRFLRRMPPDVIELRRRLADRALALNRYPFA